MTQQIEIMNEIESWFLFFKFSPHSITRDEISLNSRKRFLLFLQPIRPFLLLISQSIFAHLVIESFDIGLRTK